MFIDQNILDYYIQLLYKEKKMALQISYEDSFGNTNASAYHRVLQVLVDKSSSVADILVGIYKDASARGAGKSTLASRHYRVECADFETYFGTANMNIVDKNAISIAYDYLKTLSEYNGASDV